MSNLLTRRRVLVPAALAGLALLATGGSARSAARVGPLQSQAEAIVPGAGTGWTVMAWSMDRRETLFAINAHKVHVPASNNKVFSAIWAMDVLGADYRFPTDVLVGGPIENGVVRGDVIIKGSGDPGFGYPEYDKEPLTAPRRMAQALKARGVRVVEGGVIADATVFDTLMYGPDWPRDTGNGVSAYAPTVSGLAYQRNMLWVEVKPGQGLELDPQVPEIPVVSQMGRGGRGYAVRKPGEDTIYVRGGFSGRGPFRYGVGAADPALLGAGALRQALREQGIEVRGPVRRGAAPKGATLVHRHYSIRLGDMVPQLNRKSDNFFAEHFWKAAAARAIGEGSYPRGGPASALFFHQRANVPFGEIWQADGSGLSAQNRTSAFALVSALAYAHQRPWSKEFHESLALGGDAGGTLRRLFNSGNAKGNLHAKTGYIRGVRSLSGYVKTRDGELVVFSFIYNGANTSGARGIQQQLGDLLAEWSRPGGGAAAGPSAAAANPADSAKK